MLEQVELSELTANEHFANIGPIVVADDQKINLELIKLNL